TTKTTRQQVAKYQSDVYISSAQKRDARGGIDEVLDLESTNPKPTNTASIHTESTHSLSVSPADLSISNDNEQKVQALCELLDGLKYEDVSDTELDSLLPPFIINFSPEINDTRDKFKLSSYNHTNNYNDPNSVQLYTKEAEKYDNILQSKSDVILVEHTLENDLLKHLTVNNSNEESNENNVCRTNEFPDTYANSNCENAFIGSGNLDVLSKLVLPLSRKTDGHRDIIPLRKRSSGLELLRNTWISRTYFGNDLLKHLTINNSNEESNENNVCRTNEFPDTWSNNNCENAFIGSGILDVLSKLVLPLSRKTDGYLRQNLLKTVKCT
ncbi:unnamed protein product, partial [Trichobilharzia regenti]